MKAIKFDQKVEEEDFIMAEVSNGTVLRTLVSLSIFNYMLVYA